jgi:hypothetical protein
MNPHPLALSRFWFLSLQSLQSFWSLFWAAAPLSRAGVSAGGRGDGGEGLVRPYRSPGTPARTLRPA